VIAFLGAAQLLQLNLSEGMTFDFVLSVKREKPASSGEIHSRVSVNAIDKSVIELRDDLTGISINGADRTADMKACLDNAHVFFEWNRRGQRAGAMSPLNFRRQMPSDMIGVFGEAGLYLCEFPGKPVSPGDSWAGSTTATGGCTSGFYTLKAFRSENGIAVADIEVTKIAMRQSDQVGPMKMVVDVKTGMPIRVDYRVQDKVTKKQSQITQTWIRP